MLLRVVKVVLCNVVELDFIVVIKPWNLETKNDVIEKEFEIYKIDFI